MIVPTYDEGSPVRLRDGEPLLGADLLPDGFTYPADFLTLIRLDMTDLTPWQIVGGDFLRHRHLGIRRRYPDRQLVPFAYRQDNDDTACWDLHRAPGSVVVIHDFASPSWEQRREYRDLRAWLHVAVEDMFDFE